MTETENRKVFIDYIEDFKKSYNSDEHDNKDVSETIEELLKAVEKTIEMDIFINLNKIASHNNETFEKYVNGIKINREDYSLGVVFNKIPSNEEISKVVACICVLPLIFKVNYRSIVVEETEEEGKKINIILLKIQEEEKMKN
jgi:hypothetical protein